MYDQKNQVSVSSYWNTQFKCRWHKKRLLLSCFLTTLQEMGGTTEEALSQCSWEDFRKNVVSQKLIARQNFKKYFGNTSKLLYLKKI